MGIFIAILVVYCFFQLNRGGNNGMFTKLKAVWFKAQYGEGSVVKVTRDCVRPSSGIRLRVTFKSRFLRTNKENTALVRVPREFTTASESVQDAVLVEILGREGISVRSIESTEEADDTVLEVVTPKGTSKNQPFS